MLDALGFRGIWRRHAPEAVVAHLESLVASMQFEAAKLAGPPGDWISKLEVAKPVFLSDTIAFGLVPKTLEQINANGAILGLTHEAADVATEVVRLAAHLAALLLRRALVGMPALAYRGAISFGEFGMTDRFIIGEAVDEAAECEKRPQGAFVVLADSAQKLPHLPRDSGISPLLPYDVPTKRASSMRTHVVVPYELPEAHEQPLAVTWPSLLERLESTFRSDDPRVADDIEDKRQKTMAFMASVDPTERLTPEAFLQKTLGSMSWRRR